MYIMVSSPFGRWLTGELTRRDMTQADFARRVGASSGRVSEWVSGKRAPSPESLDRITDALPGVSLDHLLSLAGHRPLDPDVDPDDPRRRIATRVQMINLTPDREAGLIGLLEAWEKQDRRTREREQSKGGDS